MERKSSGRFQLIVEKEDGSGGSRLLLFDTLTGSIWLSSNMPDSEPIGSESPTWVKLALPRELRRDTTTFERFDGPKGTFSVLESMERDVISTMLQETGGNKLETAKRLGIGRQTLYNKMHEYGIK
jgi:DNA-binding NtrC family response regulator